MRTFRAAAIFLVVVAAGGCWLPAAAQTPANNVVAPAAQAPAASADPVLIENATTQIRRSDFNAELLRLPPDARPGFVNSERRIRELLPRMLVTKTLATQASELGIDKEPDVVAQIRNATERALAQLRLARVEAAAAKEFESKRSVYEARAHELYLADRNAYVTPEQVEASHILFSLAQHSKEDALKLAEDARAKIMAGANFNQVARDLSEDPSATENSGHLGWFSRGAMDPAFAAAAFKLAKVGDVSEPVLSRFGWHLIKLEGKRPAGLRPFDEVRAQIMAQLEQKYVDDKRDAFLLAIRNDPKITFNDKNVEALVVRAPDAATVEKAVDALQPPTSSRPAPSAPIPSK
ncbi:MAG: peptidylprolyl isomerase [Betaproteobacteria bacterium]